MSLTVLILPDVHSAVADWCHCVVLWLSRLSSSMMEPAPCCGYSHSELRETRTSTSVWHATVRERCPSRQSWPLSEVELTHTHTPQAHSNTGTSCLHPLSTRLALPSFHAHTWVEPSSRLPHAISCGCDNAAVPHPAFHCRLQPTVLFIVPSSVQPSVIWPPRTGRAGLAS